MPTPNCFWKAWLRIRIQFIRIPIRIQHLSMSQCCGSMIFWGGSGSVSANSCFFLMDPDPNIFVIVLQYASKKIIFLYHFLCFLVLKLHLYYFSKIKSKKESQNSKNQGFCYYCCMIIEWSRYGSCSGSESIPLTGGSGSGSRRPKTCGFDWSVSGSFIRIHRFGVISFLWYRYVSLNI